MGQTYVKILTAQDSQKLADQIFEHIKKGYKVEGYSGPGGDGFPDYTALMVHEASPYSDVND